MLFSFPLGHIMSQNHLSFDSNLIQQNEFQVDLFFIGIANLKTVASFVHPHYYKPSKPAIGQSMLQQNDY
jgi:hypothetical protein